MIWGAIVVAAGRGTRFGRPKQLVEVAGKPLVAWSIESFAAMLEIADLVIATEREYVDAVESIARAFANHLTVRVIVGGQTRQESVFNALQALDGRCTGVLIHDGARPLVRPNDVRNGMRLVRPGIATLLASPVIDTIKVVDENGLVTKTLDRATLWGAQTPQFATVRDMRRAHIDARATGFQSTDDSALLERAGVDVVVVAGSPENTKVTHPDDLARIEPILRERGPLGDGSREILLIEAFVPEPAVEAVCNEIERRTGTLDGIERDLPTAVVVRAFLPSSQLRDFGLHLHAIAGEEALFTTHLSHVLTADDR